MKEITENITTKKKEKKVKKDHLLTYADICKESEVSNLYLYSCLSGNFKMGDKVKNKLILGFERSIEKARIKFLADLEHACNNGAVNNRNYVKKYPK